MALLVLTVSTQPVDSVNDDSLSPDIARDSGREMMHVARRTWDGKFALTLQERGVGSDELVRLA